MNQPRGFPPPFRLEEWLVQPELNRVVGPQGEVQLEPRVMQVLLHLAERPGQVRSRTELLDLVWGDAIVGEENLTRAVSDLRRVFADDPRRPRFVETIRSHGYRLICPVENDGGTESVATKTARAESEASPDRPPERPPVQLPEPPVQAHPVQGQPTARKSLGLWPAVAAILVVLVAGFWLLKPLLRDAVGPERDVDALANAPLTAVPLTSYPGREWQPALSSNGDRVAFVWAGPAGDNVDLYVKQRNNETPLRLTDDTGWAAWPVWSPDGQFVAFVQGDDQNNFICTVPAAGGPVRRLLSTASWIEGLDWSPAGDRLVFSAQMAESDSDETGAQNGDQARHRLHFLDLTTLAVTRFTGVDRGSAGDYQPRFAPDGSALAWIGMEQTGAFSLCTAATKPEPSAFRRLVSGMTALQGLAWTADSRELVYSAAPAGVFNLWRIPAQGGEATWLPTPGEYAWNPAVARRSGDLVYEQVRFDRDIRQIRILGRDPWQLATSSFVASTRWDYDASYSPDGRQVVFVSARSGNPELWLCDENGANLRRLTSLGETVVSNPRWSGDGRQIGFNVMRDGKLSVLVIAVSGGRPLVVTPPGRSEMFAGWSGRAGRLLIASREDPASDRPGDKLAGSWQIFAHDLDGATRRRLTSGGGLVGQPSADGKWLYHTRPGRSGLWRQTLADPETGDLPAADSEPEQVVGGLVHRDRYNWVVQDSLLAFVARRGANAYLMFHDARTGRSEPLTDLPGLTGSGLSISPDGRSVLYTRTGDTAGDLMLVDDFAP